MKHFALTGKQCHYIMGVILLNKLFIANFIAVNHMNNRSKELNPHYNMVFSRESSGFLRKCKHATWPCCLSFSNVVETPKLSAERLVLLFSHRLWNDTCRDFYRILMISWYKEAKIHIYINSLAPGRMKFLISNLHANFSDWWLRYLVKLLSDICVTGPYWW